MGTKNPPITWHPEIFSEKQQTVLKRLGSFLTQEGFYMGGGTAVALYFGHRRSFDLDWFTPQPLKDPLGLSRRIMDLTPFSIDQMERGTLHGRASEVRISCLEYRYPLLKKLQPFSDYQCRVAAWQDLACMKLAAVSQRGSKKDFVDLMAMMETTSLKTMLKWYQKKYPVNSITPVLYGLVYFDEADQEGQPKMIQEIPWEEAKQTLRKIVAAFYSGKRP